MTNGEVDNQMSPNRKLRGRLETVQLAVTIALLGGWLSFEQYLICKTLDQQQQQHDERLAITVQSTKLMERAKEYLEALGLEDEKTHRVLISLLAIKKDIRMSLTGEIREEGVREQVDLLPLHLALLANNSETLAHIGGKDRDLDRWLPIAEASGDVAIRQAAIDALKKIGELSDDARVIEKCVASIIKLTQRWNNADLRGIGVDAIKRIAEVHATSDIDSPDELNRQILTALRELEGASPSGEGAVGEVAVAVPETVLEDARREKERTLAEQLEAVRALRTQYESRAGVAPETKELTTLIAELESEEASTRRLARSKISDYGSEAVGPLLEALAGAPSNYRMRVGVVTALMLMPQPLVLDHDQLKAIVPLLGDPDRIIRTNTAQLLGQSTDSATLAATIQILTEVATDSRNYDNANYIYNCVIVLVDWLRWNDYVKGSVELKQAIKATLSEIDVGLARDDRTWTSTRGRIDEGLGMVGS